MKGYIPIFLILIGIQLLHVYGEEFAADQCAGAKSCSDCLNITSCGWCGPTQTCRNGTKQGPSDGTQCYGDAWFYGVSNPCPTCGNFGDCKSCLYWQTDCFWCQKSQKCHEWGAIFGCPAVDTCPCDVYPTCTECVRDPGCFWCGANNTCMNSGSSCALPSHTCPCGDNTDCDTCMQDSAQGCVWCDSEGGAGSCQPTGTPGCTMALNCNQYCQANGPYCDACNSLNGCGWCDSQSVCVDASAKTCNAPLLHSCPDCGSHHYCDTCQDAGCVWCQNGECRRKGQTNGCMIIPSNQCDQYCGYFSSCADCNVIPGCNWCDDVGGCVDSDTSVCKADFDCQGATCGFDGGAFVGGMFLGIGLVAIAIGGFLFYRWRMGKKAAYSELK